MFLEGQSLWVSRTGRALVLELPASGQKAEVPSEGFSRYIVSLSLPDGDRVSSVFGTDVYPVELKAPEKMLQQSVQRKVGLHQE